MLYLLLLDLIAVEKFQKIDEKRSKNHKYVKNIIPSNYMVAFDRELAY